MDNVYLKIIHDRDCICKHFLNNTYKKIARKNLITIKEVFHFFFFGNRFSF